MGRVMQFLGLESAPVPSKSKKKSVLSQASEDYLFTDAFVRDCRALLAGGGPKREDAICQLLYELAEYDKTAFVESVKMNRDDIKSRAKKLLADEVDHLREAIIDFTEGRKISLDVQFFMTAMAWEVRRYSEEQKEKQKAEAEAEARKIEDAVAKAKAATSGKPSEKTEDAEEPETSEETEAFEEDEELDAITKALLNSLDNFAAKDKEAEETAEGNPEDPIGPEDEVEELTEIEDPDPEEKKQAKIITFSELAKDDEDDDDDDDEAAETDDSEEVASEPEPAPEPTKVEPESVPEPEATPEPEVDPEPEAAPEEPAPEEPEAAPEEPEEEGEEAFFDLVFFDGKRRKAYLTAREFRKAGFEPVPKKLVPALVSRTGEILSLDVSLLDLQAYLRDNRATE